MWRYEQMLLDKTMELYPGPVRLTQTRWVRIAMVVCGGLFAILLLLLAYPGIGDDVHNFSRHEQILFGLILAPCGLLAVWLGGRELRRPHTVVLDADGFNTTSPKGNRKHLWKDVKDFQVVHRGESEDVVGFVAIHRDRRKNDGRYEDCRFAINYGISAEALSALMTRWRAAAVAGDDGPRSTARGAHG